MNPLILELLLEYIEATVKAYRCAHAEGLGSPCTYCKRHSDYIKDRLLGENNTLIDSLERLRRLSD